MSEYIIDFTDWVLDEDGELFYPNAREIVRCRDCTYFSECANERFSCWWWGDEYEDPKPDGFCAWGERRGE